MKRKILHGLTLTMLSLLATPLLTGQEAENQILTFSLQEAITYAMENNLQATNSRLDVDAADQRVWEAAASGLPQVNASMNYNYNINLATTLIPDFLGDPSDKIEVQFGTKHYATAGVVGNQLIFSGQYIVGLQTARIFKEFTEKNRERTEIQVRQSIIQNYFLVLLGEGTLSALAGNLENLENTYRETVALYNTGFVEEIEADQLAVALKDLENNVLSMERQVTASRNMLKYQMGLDRNTRIQLTDSLEALVNRVDFDATLGANLDLNKNVDFRILQDQERLALMDMRLKKTDYLPSLSAFYTMDFAAQRDEFNFFQSDQSWYRSSIVGLSLNLPIFSSGLRRAGVAQKRIAYEQAVNNREYAAEGLQVEFLQARYDFATALEKYRSDLQNLEVAEKVVQVTQIKYEEGLAASLELTQVNDQFLRTLSSYTSSMVELLNAKIKIDQLLNTI